MSECVWVYSVLNLLLSKCFLSALSSLLSHGQTDKVHNSKWPSLLWRCVCELVCDGSSPLTSPTLQSHKPAVQTMEAVSPICRTVAALLLTVCPPSSLPAALQSHTADTETPFTTTFLDFMRQLGDFWRNRLSQQIIPLLRPVHENQPTLQVKNKPCFSLATMGFLS